MLHVVGTAEGLAGQQVVPLLAVNVNRHMLILVDARADVRMDADDPALEVEQRSARVTRNHRRVRDEELGRLARDQDPSQADGRGAALLHSARMPQGHAPGTGLDVVRVAHLDVRPLARLGDLGHARIAGEVGAQGLGGGAAAIGEDDRQLGAGLAQDVARGKHQAVLADHHAAALADVAVAGQRLVDDAHGRPEHFRDHRLALGFDPLQRGHRRRVFGVDRANCHQPHSQGGNKDIERGKGECLVRTSGGQGHHCNMSEGRGAAGNISILYIVTRACQIFPGRKGIFDRFAWCHRRG